MKGRHWTAMFLVLGLGAGVASAHEGVKDPDVLARMQSMSRLKEELALLGGMAKGEARFDAAEARAAARSLSQEATRIVPLFDVRANDPASEALPEIWTRFDDFETRAAATADAAAGAAQGITDRKSLRRAMGRIGKTCRSCHENYRAPGS